MLCSFTMLRYCSFEFWVFTVLKILFLNVFLVFCPRCVTLLKTLGYVPSNFKLSCGQDLFDILIVLFRKACCEEENDNGSFCCR